MMCVVKKSVFSFLNALILTKLHSCSKPIFCCQYIPISTPTASFENSTSVLGSFSLNHRSPFGTGLGFADFDLYIYGTEHVCTLPLVKINYAIKIPGVGCCHLNFYSLISVSLHIPISFQISLNFKDEH